VRGGRVLTVAVLVAASLGACAPSESTFAAGYYGIDESVVIRNLTIDDGSYIVGYALEMRVVSPVAGGGLSCQLDEVSGRLTSFQETPSTIDADAAWSKLEYFGRFDVPNITVGIRCTPTIAGQYAITVRNVDLYARRVSP
jgi:hypothetical protein